MKQIITTNRLILRELTRSDSFSFFLLNENPNNIKYTGDVAFTSLNESEQFLKNYKEYKKNGFGRWAVIRKQDYKIIGWCGLKKVNDEIDLGFRFYEEYWNLGYATESAIGVVNYAFDTLRLEKIVARCNPNNIASQRVIEKVGFKFKEQKDHLGISNALIYILQKSR